MQYFFAFRCCIWFRDEAFLEIINSGFPPCCELVIFKVAKFGRMIFLNKINIGIVAHVDAGKTTVIENLILIQLWRT
ncbi:GTP-binding protein [Clostridium hydrogenum]|uniref:GTP-binding protein n=1 Tax=Clostridium hydrogenum TaxID=2855764 RepID=UPI001F491AA1|nr:GTP-binding protein [Clostridium hydrogenum]